MNCYTMTRTYHFAHQHFASLGMNYTIVFIALRYIYKDCFLHVKNMLAFVLLDMELEI